jgi:L-alanine-DL-glutamate epimerase-like enolase superfamily enzyme
MSLHLTQETLRLGLRDPFRIARADHGGDEDRVTTVVIELRDDRFPGVVGLGEGYPDRFYGETPETMRAVFPLLLEAVAEVSPDEPGLAAADLAMEAAIRGHGAAGCAVDIALHDLIG